MMSSRCTVFTIPKDYKGDNDKNNTTDSPAQNPSDGGEGEGGSGEKEGEGRGGYN